MADELQPMGEGRIEPERVPEELRLVRHNLRSMHTTQLLHGELIANLAPRVTEIGVIASRAEATADKAVAAVTSTNQDLYGHPDRKDDFGVIGEIKGSLRRQSAQNWAILGAQLLLIVTLVAALWQGLAHH
jgi:hypothetical protein